MHVGKKNLGLPYSIHDSEISVVSKEKDIGFWIQDDLSTSTHVNKARNKAMGDSPLGEISQIKSNFSYIDKRAICTMYNQ